MEKKDYYKHWLVSKNYDTKFHRNGKLMSEGFLVLLKWCTAIGGPLDCFGKGCVECGSGPLNNEKQQGLWKFYYDNGNIEMEGNFLILPLTDLPVVKHGIWRFYNKNGKLKEKINFKEGVEIDIKHSSTIKKISPEEKVENSLEDGALEGILGENGFYYFFSILFACIYSFVKMSIDSGGDFDRFLRPVEEFFINFGVILVIHLFFAAPIWVFSKIKFPKISFYTVLIISILSLIGSS